MVRQKTENSIVVFKIHETDLTLTEIPDDVCWERFKMKMKYLVIQQNN